jgi:hypothetical protein
MIRRPPQAPSRHARRRSHRLRAAVGTLAVLAGVPMLLIACDGSNSRDTARKALSVAEALRHRGTEPVYVRGSVLIDRRGTMRLCAALAESDPPQCSGPSLLVRRLDPTRLPRRSRSGGVTWADSVTLRGTVHGGVLTLVRQP